MSDINPIEERLAAALEFANYRNTLNRQLKMLQLRFENSLSHSTNGGTFKINPELISYIFTLLSQKKESALLLDIHNRPVDLQDLKAFLEEITDIYQSAMNDYLLGRMEIQKARSVKTLTGV